MYRKTKKNIFNILKEIRRNITKLNKKSIIKYIENQKKIILKSYKNISKEKKYKSKILLKYL